MKIILCEDVDNLGDMGDTVSVAAGYARNYLLPRRLAVSADSASTKQIEHEMRIIKRREAKRRDGLVEIAKTLDGAHVVFHAKAGVEGKLFGSITTLHIAEKLAELGHPVNRKKIQLAETIKSLGDHDVTVRLASGIDATVKIRVEAEEPDEPEVPAEEPADTIETIETGEAAGDGAPDTQPPAEDPDMSEVIISSTTSGEDAPSE